MKAQLLSSLIFLFIFGSANAITLNEKLENQWNHFSKARELLLERNQDKTLPGIERQLSREEWEDAIRPSEEYRFTIEDINKLVQDQDRRVQAAKEAALKSSIIDLAKLRSLPKPIAKERIATFCSELPKGGMLHIHPFGSISRETLQRIMQEENPQIPSEGFLKNLSSREEGGVYLYPSELKTLKAIPNGAHFLDLSNEMQKAFFELLFLPPGDHPFERFDAVFWTLGVPVPTRAIYKEALIDFAKKAQKQKVSYIEFTTGVSKKNIEFLTDLAEIFEEQFQITLRLNNSFYRLSQPEKLYDSAKKLVEKVQSPLLVGIDLLGNEKYTPALEHGQSAYATISNAVRSGKSTLKQTMHAGELGDPRNPRDAMIMGVDRIGHGVLLVNDPISIEYAIKKQIAIEINLTSNIRLQAIDDLNKHPFLRYLRLGIPVSLSTDDEGIFDTDINTECELAITTSDITYSELKKMSYHSIKTSFADKETKEKLQKRLDREFSIFEKLYTLTEKPLFRVNPPLPFGIN